jgi:hypothetical protein
MATLYPTPLPRYIEDDPLRAAERRVYDALREGLGQEFSVFYGVAWLGALGAGARDGEVDFVIAHPEGGILLLEVKGGAISRDGTTGRWTSVDHAGYPHPIQDPFAQVRTSKHALLEKFKEHPTLRHVWIPMGHGVVFPDSARPDVPLGPDAPPEITVFAEDMNHIDDCVEGMFDYWRRALERAERPGAGFVAAVTDLLAPSFDLRQPLGTAVADEDRELLRLTEHQFSVLDLLGRQRRVSVTGGAGTGKTLLALEKAKRLAGEGFKVLLTCFNRPLADHLRRSAGGADGLTILTFHQLCEHFARAGDVALPSAIDGQVPADFFDKTMPNALLEALRCVRQRFDAIVVDEGQDFLEGWWYPLQFCLADPDRGVLYVFHDDNQQIYRRATSFPSGLVEITLHENLRNTQKTHALTSRFYRGEPVRAIGPEGRFVEAVVVESKEGIEQAVSAVLERLLKKEYASPEDIAVLLGWAPSSPLKRDTQIGVFQVTRDQDGEPGRILLESVRRFKGLERPIVILTAVDELPPEEADALLYVGLSRARIHLVVVAQASTIARLGIDTRC